MTLPLFVYGTLASGGQQSFLLDGLERRPARVLGRLYRLPAGYPALAPGGSDPVYGELVGAPPERLLALLDHYEGVAEGLFARVVVRALVGSNSADAWAYVMRDPRTRGGRHLPSGRWRALRNR